MMWLLLACRIVDQQPAPPKTAPPKTTSVETVAAPSTSVATHLRDKLGLPLDPQSARLDVAGSRVAHWKRVVGPGRGQRWLMPLEHGAALVMGTGSENFNLDQDLGPLHYHRISVADGFEERLEVRGPVDDLLWARLQELRADLPRPISFAALLLSGAPLPGLSPLSDNMKVQVSYIGSPEGSGLDQALVESGGRYLWVSRKFITVIPFQAMVRAPDGQNDTIEDPQLVTGFFGENALLQGPQNNAVPWGHLVPLQPSDAHWLGDLPMLAWLPVRESAGHISQILLDQPVLSHGLTLPAGASIDITEEGWISSIRVASAADIGGRRLSPAALLYIAGPQATGPEPQRCAFEERRAEMLAACLELADGKLVEKPKH